MPDMSAPRKCYITVEYDGKNITREISTTLIDFTYNDKASGEADDVDILLSDIGQRWITDWYPKLRKKEEAVKSGGGGSNGSKKSASSDDLNFDWDDILNDLLDYDDFDDI